MQKYTTLLLILLLLSFPSWSEESTQVLGNQRCLWVYLRDRHVSKWHPLPYADNLDKFVRSESNGLCWLSNTSVELFVDSDIQPYLKDSKGLDNLAIISLTGLDQTLDLTQYDRIFLMIPCTHIFINPQGTIGKVNLYCSRGAFRASLAWIMVCPRSLDEEEMNRQVRHENGHNLGFPHGGPSKDPYHDFIEPWNVMGSGYEHYSIKDKINAGWLK